MGDPSGRARPVDPLRALGRTSLSSVPTCDEAALSLLDSEVVSRLVLLRGERVLGIPVAGLADLVIPPSE